MLYILSAFFALGFSFVLDLTLADICGTYQQSADICSPGQKCIADTITTYNDVRSFLFGTGGSYTSTHQWSTGILFVMVCIHL